MPDESDFDKSLADALAAGEMGAQSLQGGRLNNVLLPNRFNGRNYWFLCGEQGQLPTIRKKHRLLGGIIAFVRMHGVDPANGWRSI